MESDINKMNFLDLTIYKEENKHMFKIFRKETQSDLVIPKNSHHPWQHKSASFRSMVYRLINIPMKKTHYEEERNTIKSIAMNNGYKANMIDKIIKKMQKKPKSVMKSNTEKEKYICLPYNSVLNKSIRKTFTKSNYKVSYKTKNNSFKIIQNLSNAKNQNSKNIYEKSGIYKIKCSDCSKFYIGQTGRNFKCRFREHIQAIKSNNRTSQKSTFAEHILQTQHGYKNITHNMEILNISQKGEKMNTLEDFQIYIHKKQEQTNILNLMQIENINPIFEKINHLRKTKSNIKN